jgi:hypothetical protein
MPLQGFVCLTKCLKMPALFGRDSPSILEPGGREKVGLMKEYLGVFSSADFDVLTNSGLTSVLVEKFSLGSRLIARFALIALHSE